VLISEVAGGQLRPLAIWDLRGAAAGDAALQRLAQEPIGLEYPLIEAEVVRGHGARLVKPGSATARSPEIFSRTLGWSSYVVAALTARGESIGLLHAQKDADGASLEALDAEVAAKYAEGLSGVLQRAVLRHTLALHEAELGAGVAWIAERVSRLSDGGGFETLPVNAMAERRQVDSLTRRELEVMRLLAGGNTNRAIARTLVVHEDTAKYHVKNILRKLGATSRTDAVSRFLRSPHQSR